MKMYVGLVCAVAALLCAGCTWGWARGTPTEPIQVLVDNAMDDPVVVRIDGRRVGEAEPPGRTVLSVPRLHIAGRRVTVCVDPIGSFRILCHPGRLLVPRRVEEIWVTVRRSGQVHASVL